MLCRASPFTSSLVRVQGLGRGMRFGRQKAESLRSQQPQSALEQLYSLAKSTFQFEKDAHPLEVERLKELVCESCLTTCDQLAVHATSNLLRDTTATPIECLLLNCSLR